MAATYVVINIYKNYFEILTSSDEEEKNFERKPLPWFSEHLLNEKFIQFICRAVLFIIEPFFTSFCRKLKNKLFDTSCVCGISFTSSNLIIYIFVEMCLIEIHE